MKKILATLILSWSAITSAHATQIQPADLTVANGLFSNSVIKEVEGRLYLSHEPTADDVRIFKKYWGDKLTPGTDIGIGQETDGNGAKQSYLACFMNGEELNTRKTPRQLRGPSPCFQSFGVFGAARADASRGIAMAAGSDAKNDLNTFMKNARFDLVSRVLNYSDCLSESDCGDGGWYVIDASKCIYARALLNADGTFQKEAKVINLNLIAPSSLWVGEINAANLRGIAVKSEAQNLFFIPMRSMNGTEALINRISNGWRLIYQNHCPGKKTDF